jgi:hypothetical protein
MLKCDQYRCSLLLTAADLGDWLWSLGSLLSAEVELTLGDNEGGCTSSGDRGAHQRIRFLSRMTGGEASVRKGMERSRLRKPSLSQNEDARP